MTKKKSNQSKILNVRIDLTVPQGEIAVTRREPRCSSQKAQRQ